MAFDFGSFLSGAVDESSRQRKLRMDEEDQTFQREQQQAWRDDQARNKKVREGLAAVQPAGISRDPQAILDQDFTQNQTIPTINRTDVDVLRDQANVYRGLGMAKESAEFGNLANQAQQQQRTMRQQKIEDSILSAARLGATGDLAGGFATLSQAYDDVPDGLRLVSQKGPNGELLAGLQGQDGKWRTQPQPLTRENFDQLIQNAMGFTSTSAFQALRDYGLKGRQVAAVEQNAATQELWRQAQADRMNQLLPWEIQRMQSQIAQDRAQAAAAGRANRGEPGTWQAIGADSDGAPVFFNAKQFDPRTPGSGIARADGKPVSDMNRLYKKVTGEGGGTQGLKFVQDPTSGQSFFADTTTGMPKARMDPRGQFPMIPFQNDPREDKNIAAAMAKNGIGLDVVSNPRTGAMMWGYRGKDGGLYSTIAEAISPPQPKVGPSAGSATGAAKTFEQQAPATVGDKTQTQGIPTRREGESFQQFRDRVIAEGNAKKEAERAARPQREAEERKKLEERLRQNAAGLRRPLVD